MKYRRPDPVIELGQKYKAKSDGDEFIICDITSKVVTCWREDPKQRNERFSQKKEYFLKAIRMGTFVRIK